MQFLKFLKKFIFKLFERCPPPEKAWPRPRNTRIKYRNIKKSEMIKKESYPWCGGHAQYNLLMNIQYILDRTRINKCLKT